jgi:hypothetical protein
MKYLAGLNPLKYNKPPIDNRVTAVRAADMVIKLYPKMM